MRPVNSARTGLKSPGPVAGYAVGGSGKNRGQSIAVSDIHIFFIFPNVTPCDFPILKLETISLRRGLCTIKTKKSIFSES